MDSVKFLFCGSLILLSPLLTPAQGKAAPSRPRPSPQISGKLIGTGANGRLILEYKRDSGRGTFIGSIQSTCMIPAKSNDSEITPLELSQFPKGSQLTVFYVRHARKLKGVKKAENTILAVRFDRVNGDSFIPQGKMIPCFQGEQAQTTK